MEIHEPPPRGFKVGLDDQGQPEIRYRTRGMGCMGLFFAVWLTGWTIACAGLTLGWLHIGDGAAGPRIVVRAVLLSILSIPFYAVEVGVLGYVIWKWFSVTVFGLGDEQLLVRRSLWRYRRQRVFRRQAIRRLMQVRDGGQR